MEFDKRPVIDMTTLKIYKSLNECAKELGFKPATIFDYIESNAKRLDYDRYKSHKHDFRLEYLDVWLEYDDRIKRNIYNKKDVDFFTIV